LRISDSRILGILFAFEKEEAIGGWKTAQPVALYLLSSSGTVKVIRSKGMGWDVRVLRMRENRSPYGILLSQT
jgi:hypothetical protein